MGVSPKIVEPPTFGLYLTGGQRKSKHVEHFLEKLPHPTRQTPGLCPRGRIPAGPFSARRGCHAEDDGPRVEPLGGHGSGAQRDEADGDSIYPLFCR